MNGANKMSPSHLLPAFSLSVQSGELAVREALAGIIAGLTPLSLDVEEVATVELVLAEALNNIVEHAYPEGSEGGAIGIACRHARDGLHITMQDEGESMPDGQIPFGMAPDVDGDVMDLPEGGFGWFLIKDLAKDIRYRREGAVNLLDLRLAVALRRKPDAPSHGAV